MKEPPFRELHRSYTQPSRAVRHDLRPLLFWTALCLGILLGMSFYRSATAPGQAAPPGHVAPFTTAPSSGNFASPVPTAQLVAATPQPSLLQVELLTVGPNTGRLIAKSSPAPAAGAVLAAASVPALPSASASLGAPQTAYGAAASSYVENSPHVRWGLGTPELTYSSGRHEVVPPEPTQTPQRTPRSTATPSAAPAVIPSAEPPRRCVHAASEARRKRCA